jgi:TetR/AcrR family transcriptional regulator, regulator of cefoperazone and chloramphenicol sensitivity
MTVNGSDLNTRARIRKSALELFAASGVKATSIRDVAQAAGVSAGTVQHHFPSKDALCEGVNQYVVAITSDAFADLGGDDSDPVAITEDLGRRITALVRDSPNVLRYVARSVADGEEAALAAFDGFVGIASALQQRSNDDGVLHDDLDLVWSALNVVVLNLATVLFERAVSRHLPAPFFSPDSLERWRRADTDLFRRAFYRDHDTAHPRRVIRKENQ